MAVSADSASAKQIEHELAIIKRKEEKLRAKLTEVSHVLKGVTLEFEVRAGEEGKLFGSVTNAMIAEKLEEAGHVIDRRKIVLAEPIRTLGIFPVTVKLGNGVEAEIKVWVNPIKEEEKPEEEKAKEEKVEEEKAEAATEEA